MSSYQAYPVGTQLKVTTNSKYENLPIHTGMYVVVHDSYFNGEKYFTGVYSPYVKTVKKEGYSIEDKVYDLDKRVIQELAASGHLIEYPPESES